jgi:hypothetical protein
MQLINHEGGGVKLYHGGQIRKRALDLKTPGAKVGDLDNVEWLAPMVCRKCLAHQDVKIFALGSNSLNSQSA